MDDRKIKCENYHWGADKDVISNTCLDCINFESKINVPDRNTMGQRFYDLGGFCYKVEEFYGIAIKSPYSEQKDSKDIPCLCGSFTCIEAMVKAIKEKADKREECNCKNFVKVKLPRVTLSEAGQRYWQLYEEFNTCTALKKSYGLADNKKIECGGCRCADHSCINKITDAINKERGY